MKQKGYFIMMPTDGTRSMVFPHVTLVQRSIPDMIKQKLGTTGLAQVYNGLTFLP